MLEMKKKRLLTIMMAAAVIISMCFVGNQLTASAATSNKPGTPKITKATATQTSVKLTWSKAKKADGYRVYKYNGKKYVKIKTLKARTYTIKKLKANTTYRLKVKSYNKVKIRKGKYRTYYSNLSKVRSIKTKKADVLTPVKISVSNQSAATGSAVTFSATASEGTGQYTYQWYQKSIENTEFVKISNATSSTYSPQTGTTGKVTMHNNGTEYKCVVTDSSSNTASATGKLTVTGATEIGSWNIGAANGTTYYDGSNGTSDVVATLYSDGELAVTGTGDTVVFYTVDAPWCTATYKSQVKSSTIASTVKTTNMQFWYYGCSNLTEAPSIPASVEKMQATFRNCTSLTNAPDLTGCTSLTSMFSTFFGCTSLTDMSSYIIPAGVTNMDETFNNCTQLTKAPAMPSGVENMRSTFEGCTALLTAPDMTKCTSLTSMMRTFKDCTALLSAPDITKCTSLTDMDNTFCDCTALATGPSVIPASVTDMYFTFKGCKALTGTMQINASPSDYDYCFYFASINTGTLLTIYCALGNASKIAAIVKTGTDYGSNIE